MEYLCPLCEKKLNHTDDGCDKLYHWFQKLQGQTIWRIRYLSRYEYVFLSDDDFERLQKRGGMILDEAIHWEQFDHNSYSGITTAGNRESIFEH